MSDTNYQWQRSILDDILQEFQEDWISIGPKLPAWKDRVKLEIEKIIKYINFLRSNKNEPWVKLYPEKNPRYNYLIWTGNLLVPQRPEINFDFKVLLTSEYPKVSPRCFIEEKIVNYSGKLFLNNIWEQDGKKYVMMCHEHMSNTHSWRENLGIAHFFIRQVWVWWAAQQNQIIKQYDKKSESTESSVLSEGREQTLPKASEDERKYERVKFTSGYPSCVHPEVWYSLLIYLHTKQWQSKVLNIIDRESYKLGQLPITISIDAGIKVSRGAKFTLTPRMEGIVFNPSKLDIIWYEDLIQVEFRLKASSSLENQFMTGVIDVSLEERPVAQIPLSIKIGDCEEDTISTSKAKIFNKIFISYSHKDKDIVDYAVKWYQVLGVEILMDKSKLLSGHPWSKDIKNLIGSSDIFQLYWSTSSKESKNVEVEWRHALALEGLKGEFFIRPFFWEENLPEPPSELKHLHFAKMKIQNG